MDNGAIARDILTSGYGRIRLDADGLAAPAVLYAAAGAFYGQPPEWKAVFGGAGVGWQPRHTAAILATLAAHYDYSHTIEFAGTSCVEIGRYGTTDGPVPLIAPHVDGHLLTLVAADKPGQENQVGGEMTDAWDGDCDMLVPPGQLMEMMTDGEVPGLFHLAAYRGEGRRQGVMFFVNLPFGHDIPTFTGRPAGVAEQARRNNMAFGQAIPAELA